MLVFSTLHRATIYYGSRLATTGARRLCSQSTTMPFGFQAVVGALETYHIPELITSSPGDRTLGRAMVNALRRDGIFQVTMDHKAKNLYAQIDVEARRFFALPRKTKAACVDSQSYSGYIASAEEITDGIRDYSEIFTVTKDLPLHDPRVVQKWPCHGPCPWPDAQMRDTVVAYMDHLAYYGDRLLALVELALDTPAGSLTGYTRDGWHHLRILKFPERFRTNGRGKDGRGIGSHTDYGLLVIAAQDEVGGLFVRPPNGDEKTVGNWQESTAGLNEDKNGWMFVPPVPETFTVFPGDIFQYMTNSYLMSTPHKVGLNTRERFALAYFHEPNFQAVTKPLPGFRTEQTNGGGLHYGMHFTNMFRRNYPDRITTKCMDVEQSHVMLQNSSLHIHPDGHGHM